MIEPVTILAIAGSLRAQSCSKAALRAARRLLPLGATFEVFELAGIPPFDQDAELEPPQAVTDLKARVRSADGILISTPEYAYSIPGVLKNAIDWASRPGGDNVWDGKPVALVTVSDGPFGGIRAQYHLRQCFVFLKMHALLEPEVAIGEAQQKFDASGNLAHEATKQALTQLVQNLVVEARRDKLARLVTARSRRTGLDARQSAHAAPA